MAEKKDTIVVATAPDGEMVAFGMLRQAEAHDLKREIEREPGWSAVMPINGSAALWPSARDAKAKT